MICQPGRAVRVAAVCSITLAAIGCASKTEPSGGAWHAQAPPAPFRRVLVFGVSRAPLVRRDLEDAFVANLVARGITAVPSSDYLPATQQADPAAFDACVKNSR